VNHSFERVRLKITARDCGLAAEWTPSAQPFTLTWRDDHGDIHMDTGGDHDASMELELVRYFDVTCSNQPRADPELSARSAAGGDPRWRATTTLSGEFIESAHRVDRQHPGTRRKVAQGPRIHLSRAQSRVGVSEGGRTRPWSGAVACFVPVPVNAGVGVLSEDERSADPARKVPVEKRVEDLRPPSLGV
jgi:hypothetical protein